MKCYWFDKACCVPNCFNSSTEGKGLFKEYFDLPAEPQARSRWLRAILIKDGDDLKVCEDHFKHDDVFRDKNNRKKLRLNSIPAVKLPEHLCSVCLGARSNASQTYDFQVKLCQCTSSSTAPLQPIEQISPIIRRTRLTWSLEEKKTLFRAIRKHGDVKVGNSNLRINWSNVVNHCRSNACFGNEKELKVVWQNMKANASKVHDNKIFGSKLDRKVCRFLFGKPHKKMKRPVNNSSNQNMDLPSTDEEEEEAAVFQGSHCPTGPQKEDREMRSAIIEECKAVEENNIKETVTCKEEEDDDSDRYYTLSDVEELFQVQIRPRPLKLPTEVISLLSSDEE